MKHKNWKTSGGEIIPVDEVEKYEHCPLCSDRLGILYQENEICSHPQSGDAVCEHCSESVFFEVCKFCPHYQRGKEKLWSKGLCLKDGKRVDPEATCSEYAGLKND
ncbi:MAG: hypothetical protein LBO09_01640 [Candidatus Peribacteria bacterium]|jgi:hypothetical protein|nr:hypothetical protein [Candidatus Peribacteria bacterium]